MALLKIKMVVRKRTGLEIIDREALRSLPALVVA